MKISHVAIVAGISRSHFEVTRHRCTNKHTPKTVHCHANTRVAIEHITYLNWILHLFTNICLYFHATPMAQICILFHYYLLLVCLKYFIFEFLWFRFFYNIFFTLFPPLNSKRNFFNFYNHFCSIFSFCSQFERLFGRRWWLLFTAPFNFDGILPIAMVCTHFEYGFDLLFACFHQYGCIAEPVGVAYAIDGILVGNINRTTTIKNILDLIDCIYRGKFRRISFFSE